uniref:ATP-dependent RNA helicase MAK5 n=1 Tax=Lygus hesperus TaxID=30085 RepID=A0A0A9YKX1_LYGHE
MQQRQRLKFIDKFKTGSIRVLIATDVASRGLDVDGLKYVVHYQVPRSTDAYIHRCGRTARCGGSGLSLLLVHATEHVSFRKLIESLSRPISSMETFALQPSVVHQLHTHLRIARQMDKLQKEVDKSRAANRWVTQTSAAA